MLIIPAAVESLLYLTPSQSKVETQTGSKSACPTVLDLSFQFHNNISVTISRSKKWITITVYFRTGQITIPLTFGDWPFGITVTRNFRPKPCHSNEKIYCKLINRLLKLSLNKDLSSFLRPSIFKLWKFL